jgi:transposase
MIQRRQSLTSPLPVQQGTHTPIAIGRPVIHDGTDGRQKNGIVSLDISLSLFAAAILAKHQVRPTDLEGFSHGLHWESSSGKDGNREISFNEMVTLHPFGDYAGRVFLPGAEIIMEDVTLIGIDLGKHSFHLHGQDRHGKAVFRKKFSRNQLIAFLATFHPCRIVMEACAGAHHMARRLASFRHDVKLINPQFVRPFVKGNKNDFIDAEAICEAASRPAMRFVTPKSEAQQILGALHRAREALVGEKVRTTNQVHSFLLEFGVSLPIGDAVIKRLPSVLAEHRLPVRLVSLLERLHGHFKYLLEQIKEVDRELARQLEEDEFGQRLLNVPGIGPVTASLLSAEIGDGKQYRCSRDFAASLGLVPRQYSTGGKANLLGISKRGDKNLRRLLVQCARAYMLRLDRHTGRVAEWVREMLTRRHSNVVACALANKLARTVWAMAAHHTEYRTRTAMPA